VMEGSERAAISEVEHHLAALRGIDGRR